MRYILPIGGHHVHAWHPSQRDLPVFGFRVAYYLYEYGIWETYVISRDNDEIVGIDTLRSQMRPRRLDLVPFGVLDECCDLNKG